MLAAFQVSTDGRFWVSPEVVIVGNLVSGRGGSVKGWADDRCRQGRIAVHRLAKLSNSRLR
jgi:hypothetical protein